MKTRLSRVCLFVLGITLAVGCGPADMQEQDTFESPTTPIVIDEAPTGDGDQVSQDDATQEEDRAVGDLSACCFVKCKGDTAYRGPFPKVKYGNCTEFGAYYCGQHHKRVEHVKWGDCNC
ncbi:MAG TPA: hypothetical protein VFZ09_48515 [Archangium sp.]|uniref:hypothetical protein n=1 Tax=Archangium sp. TaxID=1872627 RepID=UPI002E37C9B4|nr:hypothetical protein [Archangium sp.]HEX5754121.1 hypothetical protein [Archangium sp.]